MRAILRRLVTSFDSRQVSVSFDACNNNVCVTMFYLKAEFSLCDFTFLKFLYLLIVVLQNPGISVA